MEPIGIIGGSGFYSLLENAEMFIPQRGAAFLFSLRFCSQHPERSQSDLRLDRAFGEGCECAHPLYDSLHQRRNPRSDLKVCRGSVQYSGFPSAFSEVHILCCGTCAKCAKNLQAVFLREHNIQHTKLGELGFNRLPEISWVCKTFGREAGRIEGIADQFPNGIIIFYEVDQKEFLLICVLRPLYLCFSIGTMPRMLNLG